MKTLDIALKDLLRSFRSLSFIAMGFAIPLVTSGIFYFAFGGLASEQEGFSIPATRVQLVNLDQPVPGLAGYSVGQSLAEILQSDALADLLDVTESPDPAGARAAVDRQQAGVAIILPEDLTRATMDPGGEASIELYQDPTLTLGPGIVTSLVRQVIDGFSGSKIAAEVTFQQLAEHGITADQATLAQTAMSYSAWVQELGGQSQTGEVALLDEHSPSGDAEDQTDLRAGIIGLIMAGMMVFYVYYTGAITTQSLLQEEEGGTLPRLFTTPTAVRSILGGRILATLVTLILQVAVLLILSALVFGIDWGPPLSVALVSLVMILVSASFGLFVTSLLRDTRQAGLVYGGVLTLAGMVGMMGIFTANVPGSASDTFSLGSLVVPQGWGVRAWQLLLEGGGVQDLIWTLLVMIALAVAFYAIGLLRFRKRFA